MFLGWTFLLLEWHTRQYCRLRQHYIRGGDDPNYWRGEGGGGGRGSRGEQEGSMQYRCLEGGNAAWELDGCKTAWATQFWSCV
jgi:hypothetical protein